MYKLVLLRDNGSFDIVKKTRTFRTGEKIKLKGMTFTIIGVCAGARVVAEAGLLDGKLYVCCAPGAVPRLPDHPRVQAGDLAIVQHDIAVFSPANRYRPVFQRPAYAGLPAALQDQHG